MATQELMSVNVEDVHANANNPRIEYGDRAGLTASIQQRGIIEPLIVTRDPEGGYTLVAGHRRHASAIDAGLTQVPVIVRESDERDNAADMVHENYHREGLSPAELARGVQGMLDAGTGIRTIARGMGMKHDTVKALKAAHATSETTRGILHTGALTLDQAIALDEIEKANPDVYAAAIDAITAGRNVEWVLTESARTIAKAEAVAQAERIAKDTGVTILDEQPYGYDGKASRLQGDDIDAHAGSACHAIYPSTNHEGAALIQHWCTKPRAHDTTRPGDAVDAAAVEAVSEATKAERRRVIANNKAWASANDVRAAWLKDSLYPRTSIPKKHTTDVLALNLIRPIGAEHVRQAVQITSGNTNGAWPSDADYAKALGGDAASLRTHTLACVLACEDGASKTLWRENRTGFTTYLQLIEALGYVLTPPEAHYVDTTTVGNDPADTNYPT